MLKMGIQYYGRQKNIPSPPPKDVHIRFPGTYEHANIHGKRDFSDVINQSEKEKVFRLCR